MKINIKIRISMLNTLIRSRIVYGSQTWNVTQAQMNRMTSVYMGFIRKMTKGGYKRKENSWAYVLTNEDLLRISKTVSLKEFVTKQQVNYVGHLIRKDNNSIAKRLLFNDDPCRKTGPQTTLLSCVMKNQRCSPDQFFKNATERRFQIVQNVKCKM